MKKMIGIISVTMAMLLLLSGCGVRSGLFAQEVDGEIGETMSTEWFDFTIKSVEKVTEYAGHQPSSGNMLIDVVVEETNTYEESIPMGIYDFYIFIPSSEEYIGCLEPQDDTMMPNNYYLEPGDTKEYHMLYELPETSESLAISYQEVGEDETTGDTFNIPFTP